MHYVYAWLFLHFNPMLLRALTAFTNLVLTGAIPEHIRQVFFSASLTALTKKDGGIHPIAVGYTLRHVVVKTASRSVMQRWVHS